MIDIKTPEDEKKLVGPINSAKFWEEFERRLEKSEIEKNNSDSTQDICDNLLNIATEIHKQNILLSDILREMRKRKV